MKKLYLFFFILFSVLETNAQNVIKVSYHVLYRPTEQTVSPIENDYVTFLIKAKNNPVLLPYESAKNIAMQKIMQHKENYVIYEYFEKLRSNAKVNIVRLN